MLRLFTAFSGYDSQCIALQRAGIDFDLVGWSEIDKWAITAHDALFPQFAGRNYGDITRIDWRTVPDFDLFTYSFPCQDISIAGRGKGAAEGQNTRSSLLWYCRGAIEVKRPKILLMENVKALLMGANKETFRKWLDVLTDMGYLTHYAVLDAKDFGTPQHRERVFAVSVLGGGLYMFPQGQWRGETISDILEPQAEAKYYRQYNDNVTDPNTRPMGRVLQIANVVHNKGGFTNPARGRIYSPYGIAPTITTCSGGGLTPKVLTNGRIRQLTPKECFRFMGLTEAEINTLQQAGISDSQQYKLAGNSIAVPVLAAIFNQLN